MSVEPRLSITLQAHATSARELLAQTHLRLSPGVRQLVESAATLFETATKIAEASERNPATLKLRREQFTRANFDRCGGDPRRMAELAQRTGFYSAKQPLSALAWRFTRTMRDLGLSSPL